MSPALLAALSLSPFGYATPPALFQRLAEHELREDDERHERRRRRRHHVKRWRRWQTAVASWYFDEGETACGFHSTDGVANRTLPCGTRVRLCDQRCVTATVQDRGPYIYSRLWDLNPTTRDAIGCDGLCDVRWSIVRS